MNDNVYRRQLATLMIMMMMMTTIPSPEKAEDRFKLHVTATYVYRPTGNTIAPRHYCRCYVHLHVYNTVHI